MSRKIQFSLAAVILGLLAGTGAVSAATNSSATVKPSVSVSVPKKVTAGVSTAVTVRMAASVAAVEGRVFVNAAAADVVGIAPLGPGSATRPVLSGKAYAFAAYGLTAINGHTTIRIIVFPKKAGHLQVRVSIDATASKNGQRQTSAATDVVSTLGVGGRSTVMRAPAATPAAQPVRSASAARKLVGVGKINVQDVDAARGAWYAAHESGNVCTASTSAPGDANNDGCIDVVDIQAELAAKGQTTAGGVQSAAVAAGNRTFTVNSTGDLPDATNGDGICADSTGMCTLRAAMTEADWDAGNDRVEFALPGTAPVTIQITSALPNISSRNGTLTIDGYTQPGSQVNTATVGDNAIPGVEVRGNGSGARELGFYITSAGNTIRGLVIRDFWNSIMLDQAGAHDNKIIGNWIGFTRTGANAGGENFGVILNIGANHNFDGTPNLADRNLIGNVTHAEENFGSGTSFNTTQNNVLCIGPTGLTTAGCATGIDHNFGPQNHTIGGTGLNEKNVIGPTTLQGIEFSHGWNPSNHAYTADYLITNNQVIGNWVGFRGDGSYSAAFRSGQNFSSADNGQGINVYDGSNDNTVASNYVGSVYDGIQIMSPNANGNIVRDNTIGVSPTGDAAPLTGWGMVVRWGALNETLQANTIRNAAKGGFGLLNTMNSGAGTSVAYYVRITRNIVSDTSGPAIGLFGAANDNPHLSAPAILTAGTQAVTGTGQRGATVELYRASRAVGQTGLPVAYLDSATVDSTGAWTISAALAAGDTVTALQILPVGNTSQFAANVAATSATVNRPPAFKQDLGDRTDTQQDVISLPAPATDPDGDALTYSATGLPGGVSINATSGLISGTLSLSSAGSYAVTVLVTDGKATTQDTFTWTVIVADANTFATDTFDRTINNAWGTANLGGKYAIVGTVADYAVNGNAGTFSLAATANRAAILTAVSQSDVDLSYRLSLNKLPVGGSLWVYGVVRRVSATSEYRAKVRIAPNGSVWVQGTFVVNNAETAIGSEVQVPGLTATAGTYLWMRAQVSGTSPTTLKVRVWADGSAEPTTWQYSATDSTAGLQAAGAVGVRAYAGSAISNGPIVVRIDDLRAARP